MLWSCGSQSGVEEFSTLESLGEFALMPRLCPQSNKWESLKVRLKNKDGLPPPRPEILNQWVWGRSLERCIFNRILRESHCRWREDHTWKKTLLSIHQITQSKLPEHREHSHSPWLRFGFALSLEYLPLTPTSERTFGHLPNVNSSLWLFLTLPRRN